MKTVILSSGSMLRQNNFVLRSRVLLGNQSHSWTFVFLLIMSVKFAHHFVKIVHVRFSILHGDSLLRTLSFTVLVENAVEFGLNLGSAGF